MASVPRLPATRQVYTATHGIVPTLRAGEPMLKCPSRKPQPPPVANGQQNRHVLPVRPGPGSETNTVLRPRNLMRAVIRRHLLSCSLLAVAGQSGRLRHATAGQRSRRRRRLQGDATIRWSRPIAQSTRSTTGSTPSSCARWRRPTASWCPGRCATASTTCWPIWARRWNWATTYWRPSRAAPATRRCAS